MRPAPSIMQIIVSIAAAAAARSATADDDLAAQARGVLRQHCWRCHSGQGSAGGDFDVLNAADLAEQGVTAAGKPDESPLLQRIVANEMPPFEIREREPVTAPEADLLRRWIVAGAPAFPQAEGREFLPLKTVLTAVRDNLREADRESRPYLRFFTLHNLYNNPRILDEDLPLYRAALSKAVNSLSWKPRIVLPRAIDRTDNLPKDRQGFLHDTVFVVDVRDFDWDRNNAWQDVMTAYPYGLSFDNHPDDDLQRLQDDLSDLSGCELPLIRADWFVATATRPPLYHALLQIPENARDLERRLEVHIRDNFRNPSPERISRAAFARSGVSGQNRLLERHDATTGMYWKSYDFLASNGRSKLSRFPLGPRNLFPPGQHPFDQTAFEHDGGEIIFSLPNGLQGYMLVTGTDERIDAGPIAVVSDALKTSGTPEIFNGVSCMACHKHGMIPFTDAIRTGSAVFGDAERQVQRLYSAPERMNELVAEDRDRFLRALDRATGSFLQVGGDDKRPIEEFSEPVGEVARLHRLVYLDLPTVAVELELQDPQDLLKIGERRLKQLGLEPLLHDGGVISRAEWEAFDGPSLMQQTAREFRYTPLRPL